MRQVLDRRIARGREQPDYGLWAFELRATGQVAGAVLLSPLPGGGAATEIGISLLITGARAMPPKPAVARSSWPSAWTW